MTGLAISARTRYRALSGRGNRLRSYPANSGGRYLAIWRPGSGTNAQFWGWRYNSFLARHDRLWRRNMGLHDLNPLIR